MGYLLIAMLIVVWVITGVCWFICNLGNKNNPGHWYDWIIAGPALAVTYIVVKVIRLFTKMF